MARCYLALLGMLAVTAAWAADSAAPNGSRDLFLGESFYYAEQGLYFDAISHLDSELQQYYRVDDRELDPLHLHANFAEFSVGDFELSYRMHRKAGRAIAAVLEGNVSQDIKNEAAYRLARIYYEKGEKDNAFKTIERIKGKVPERVRDDERLLRAQIYTVNGQFTEAIDILKKLENVEGYEGFAGYNLGIALLLKGDTKQGALQLDKTGRIKLDEDDEASLAVRDKANLLLGNRLLKGEQPELAAHYLDRVRLEGPFSNNALLGSGWANVALGRYDRALVPWSILFKRNSTNKAVQESLLGVPYAYANLEMHGRSAVLYGHALDAFAKELVRLKESIASIRDGNFLKAMVREEIKLDSNWLIRLRQLPDTPETYYLMDLMASNDFQSLLKNYLDLEDLRQRFDAWQRDLDAYEDLIDLRRRYYEPLLPGIDERFRALDSQIRLRMEQRQSLDDKLQHLLIVPRPELLATADERVLGQQLERLDIRYQNDSSAEAEEARQHIARLKGVILWDIHTDYDRRLTEAFEHLRALDEDVAQMKEIYASYVRTRQAATQSYEGYDTRISLSRGRIEQASEKVTRLMNATGHMLEQMAIGELEHRRDRIEKYQVQARFAMAESYDRAVKAQQSTVAPEATVEPEAKTKTEPEAAAEDTEQ